MQLFLTLRDWLVWALTLAVAPRSMAAPLQRIIAVGDLHGDFTAWRDIARAAGLIDGDGDWTGKDTILVQTGDVVDRGPDSLKIIHDLMRLQNQAARGKGQVVSLVGNHEAMNMTGDLRYVSAADYAAFTDRDSERRRETAYDTNKAAIAANYRKDDPQMTDEAIRQAWYLATLLGSVEHQLAWRPDGKIGRWIVGNPAMVLLEDTLFVHAGISPPYIHLPIAEINRQVSAALQAQARDMSAIINDPVGPLWYRGLAVPDGEKPGAPPQAPAPTSPPAPPVEDQHPQLLSAYGAKRIVIGHTPILSGIAISHGGRLVRIDTGISEAYGGPLFYLEILGGYSPSTCRGSITNEIGGTVIRKGLLATLVAILASTLVPVGAASAAAGAKPLFASDEPINLTISGPIRTLSRKTGAPAVPGLLKVEGQTPETLPITLSTRGMTRRLQQICSFPPLRITFTQKPPKTSIFKGQKALKLVTHCQAPEEYQQGVLLLEYAAYQLYQALTPEKFWRSPRQGQLHG